MLVEQIADQLADAAMAHDDDALGVVVRRQQGCRVQGPSTAAWRIELLVNAARRATRDDERQCAHGQRHHGQDARRDATAAIEPDLGRQADADEGELAAGGQQQAGLHAGRPRARRTSRQSGASSSVLATIMARKPA